MEPVFFAHRDEFRQWLAQHGATTRELLVGYYKVGSGRPSITWPESVEEALCYGWIDGVRRRVDDQSYSMRFTPRRPGSIWSAVNMAKVQMLREAGRMTPAGEAAFALRQESKSAVYAYEQAQVAELAEAELLAFQAQPAAWAYFQAAPPGYRKTLLHWVTSGKRAETRAKRLGTLMTACAAGQRLR